MLRIRTLKTWFIIHFKFILHSLHRQYLKKKLECSNTAMDNFRRSQLFNVTSNGLMMPLWYVRLYTIYQAICQTILTIPSSEPLIQFKTIKAIYSTNQYRPSGSPGLDVLCHFLTHPLSLSPRSLNSTKEGLTGAQGTDGAYTDIQSTRRKC